MSLDPKCIPACAPVTGQLPPISGPQCPECPPAANTVSGIDCNGAAVSVSGAGVVAAVQPAGVAYNVRICGSSSLFNTQILCEPAPSTVKVLVVTRLDETSTAGTAPSREYYDLTTGSVYAGPVAALVACPDQDTESDAVEMCDGGTTFLRWYVKRGGQPTGVVFNTTLSGAAFTPSGSETVGACQTATPDIKVETWGFNYASPSIAADYDPNGNGPVWTPPGAALQSVTVIVRQAGTKPSSPDRIRVDTPGGKYFLTKGDARTWSVAQHSGMNEVLLGISAIEAEGNSAFDVIWTVHP